MVNMDGVEILAIQEVATEFAFNWQNFWFSVLGMALAGLLIGVIYSIVDQDVAGIIAGSVLGVLFGILLGVILGTERATPIKCETQYKVVISDEVPMNDFLARYEIIDTEGKIYTVREID